MAIETNKMVLNSEGRVKGGMRVVSDGVDDGEFIVIKVYKAAKGADISKDASLVLLDKIESDPMPKPVAGKKWALSIRSVLEQVSA